MSNMSKMRQICSIFDFTIPTEITKDDEENNQKRLSNKISLFLVIYNKKNYQPNLSPIL